MKHEKSCGALVYRKKDSSSPELLLIRHRYGGHWSFPKGHVEEGENEVQTALREVKEETGLTIELIDGFRECVEYYPKPNVKKLVVYFLGYAKDDNVHKQDEEVSETKWLGVDDALVAVTFKNDKNLIVAAKALLSGL
ncbi:MAG: NUDIX domain-containing protein [Hydrogenoanaerobacterium sp.]